MTYSTHLFRHFRFIIGQNIRAYRTKREIPLYKLARLSGVNERMLDQYELGKNEISLHHLLKIACALEIEIAELMPVSINTEQNQFLSSITQKSS